MSDVQDRGGVLDRDFVVIDAECPVCASFEDCDCEEAL